VIIHIKYHYPLNSSGPEENNWNVGEILSRKMDKRGRKPGRITANSQNLHGSLQVNFLSSIRLIYQNYNRYSTQVSHHPMEWMETFQVFKASLNLGKFLVCIISSIHRRTLHALTETDKASPFWRMFSYNLVII
jgi:hypothetical protein